MIGSIHKKRLVATATNAAYLAAAAALQNSAAMVISCILLGIGSGIHHYLLKGWSRKLDYAGMYAVIYGLLSLTITMNVWAEVAIIIGLTAATVWLAGSSRIMLGAGFGALLLLMLYHDITAAMEAASFLSISFVFNFMGDHIHKTQHSIIHGLGWHIPTAYSIILAANILI